MPRRSSARRKAYKPPARTTVRFGSTGRNLQMSKRKVDMVRREGLRLYEDGTWVDPKGRRGGPRPLPRPPQRRRS